MIRDLLSPLILEGGVRLLEIRVLLLIWVRLLQIWILRVWNGLSRLLVVIVLNIDLFRLVDFLNRLFLLGVFLGVGLLEDLICLLVFRQRREELFAAEEVHNHDDELDEEIEHAENADEGDDDQNERE